jgi:Phosphotransferase enzyme family
VPIDRASEIAGLTTRQSQVVPSAGRDQAIHWPDRPTICGMSKSKHMRQRIAVRAAREAARRVGLSSVDARVLRDAKNTLVFLPEAKVVAKVGTSALDGRGGNAFTREVAIGMHLASRQAPIVPPLLHGSGGPHEVGGLLVTLWSYGEQQAVPDEPGVELGTALRLLHEALVEFPDPLPPFIEKMERAAELFADRVETPELTPRDRRLTAGIYDSLRSRLTLEAAPRSALHGEPHAANVLWTQTGPLFIDFEAACIGPREWDLAYLPEPARAAFPERDEELLAVLGLTISFCVAAWCWAQRGRAPEVDQAAQHHLDVLRQSTKLRV